jgi:hypothetical protein
MREPKEVTISIDNQFFIIELSIDDQEPMEIFFNGLKKYVGKNSPIKITGANVDSDTMSEEKEILTKTITKGKQIDALRKEIGQITSILMKR